ncbi:MAG: tail fiber protein [Gammaproteobacteria bacterium]|nr:tail fiber protein [Gammaproteobacteria bacterium]
MSEPFIGQIVQFGGNFAPRSWALCDGQLLAISSNQALFSILGTTYGGDGRTTFGLPDLRGRVPMHPGSGPGLTPRQLGQKGGQENVTLTTQQIPQHNHDMFVTDEAGNAASPGGKVLATESKGDTDYGDLPNPPVDKLVQNAISNTGGGQSHTNIQPFQCINFIIALQGTFPSRN